MMPVLQQNSHTESRFCQTSRTHNFISGFEKEPLAPHDQGSTRASRSTRSGLLESFMFIHRLDPTSYRNADRGQTR